MRLDVSAILLFALLTTWESVPEVLVVKLLSPLYTAVIEWVATERLDVVNDAEPPLIGTVPSVAAPSLKVTLPVGVPEPDAGLTVAVNLTDWPKADGFSEDTTAVLVPAGLPALTVCANTGEVLVL